MGEGGKLVVYRTGLSGHGGAAFEWSETIRKPCAREDRRVELRCLHRTARYQRAFGGEGQGQGQNTFGGPLLFGRREGERSLAPNELGYIFIISIFPILSDPALPARPPAPDRPSDASFYAADESRCANATLSGSITHACPASTGLDSRKNPEN